MTDKKTTKKNSEPLFYITKRTNVSMKFAIMTRAIAVVSAFVIMSVLMTLLSKENPFTIISSMFDGAFGTGLRTWVLFSDTAILLGISLALTPAFKMKFWNCGGEGQVLIGALISAMMMLFVGDKIPLALLIAFSAVLSTAIGAVWGLIPAVFKAKWNINETLFTLMLNYIATGLVSMFLTIWLKNGKTSLDPILAGNFPAVFGNRYILTVSVFFILAVLMFVYLKYTKHGYEIAVVGDSPNTAKYIGIDVKRVIIRTMIMSGALAGLVGLFLAGGINHTIATDSANNMGFTAIMATWLAAFNPLVMMGTCLFIIFISRGMVEVRGDFGFTNDSIANIVIGLVYFCVIACSFFITYRVVFRKASTKTTEIDGTKGETKA